MHLEAAAQVQMQQVLAVVGNAGNAHIREALTPPQNQHLQSPAGRYGPIEARPAQWPSTNHESALMWRQASEGSNS